MDCNHSQSSGSVVYVLIDLGLQDVQGPGAVQDHVMEPLDVKLVPQPVLGSLPQLEDPDLADLVAHGLAWPGDVPKKITKKINNKKK